MPNFLVAADQMSGDRVIIEGHDAHHIFHVLRLRVGDEFPASLPPSTALCLRIEVATPKRITAVVAGREEVNGGACPSITLAQFVPKPAVMDDIVRSVSEIGVSAIIPVLGRRSPFFGVGVTAQRLGRWERIAYESRKQCARMKSLRIESPVGVSDLVQTVRDFGAALLLDATQRGEAIAHEDELRGAREALIIVGPEGGLSEDERDVLVRHGARPVGLGRPVLRVHTAAVVGCALTSFMMGGLRPEEP